jgi:glucokinase
MATPPAPGDAVVWALDIGGTKLAAAVVDRSGSVLSEDRAPTDGRGGAESLFGSVVTLLGSVAGTAGVSPAAIGVGCGGPMSAAGLTVSPLNIPAWREFPLRDRLSAHFGVPVAVDNDAKALALGEGWRGSAQGARDYLAMVVSTGVGGGIVLDGRLLDGGAGNAGHIGHVIVDPLGRPCPCGARGCLEAQVSGTALRAASGRPAAEATVETRIRCGRLVGRAVASVANLLDLRLAVVAGSVALGFGEPFFTAAQQEADRLARIEFARGLRIVPTGCGPHGPLLGAAAVGWRHLDGAAPRSDLP